MDDMFKRLLWGISLLAAAVLVWFALPAEADVSPYSAQQNYYQQGFYGSPSGNGGPSPSPAAQNRIGGLIENILAGNTAPAQAGYAATTPGFPAAGTISSPAQNRIGGLIENILAGNTVPQPRTAVTPGFPQAGTVGSPAAQNQIGGLIENIIAGNAAPAPARTASYPSAAPARDQNTGVGNFIAGIID